MPHDVELLGEGPARGDVEPAGPRHRVEAGRGAQLPGVRSGVAERSPAALGDLVGEVGLEPLGQLQAVLLGQVAQQAAHLRDEGGHVGADGEFGRVHALAPCVEATGPERSPSRVDEKACQSSLWRASWSRPMGVMP